MLIIEVNYKSKHNLSDYLAISDKLLKIESLKIESLKIESLKIQSLKIRSLKIKSLKIKLSKNIFAVSKIGN